MIEKIIEICMSRPLVFCKFLSENDVGKTKSHQGGIYIPKNSYKILFKTPGVKGNNKEHFVTIKWQNDFETDSRFIYYGNGTRNEYRITRFGRKFPLLHDDNVGDLFIFVKESDDYYLAYILSTDDDIDNFLEAFGMSSSDTNRLIHDNPELSERVDLEILFQKYINALPKGFPSTQDISYTARKLYEQFEKTSRELELDRLLLNWLKIEYDLFKAIENDRYSKEVPKLFSSVDEFIGYANTILNRRKSRAWKSLEHHLKEIFLRSHLPFESQVVTEDKKKPDFVFPGADAYHDPAYNDEKLIFLGAKTTCKDRWRQILNEADRIRYKHLFTLQQGISKNQLEEMYKNNVILVVPEPYLGSFPKVFQDRILTLSKFVGFVKARV